MLYCMQYGSRNSQILKKFVNDLVCSLWGSPSFGVFEFYEFSFGNSNELLP